MPPTEEDIAWFRSTFHPIPKPALPDDCIEYSLYIISSSVDASNESELRLRLREVQKKAADLQREWLKDYIWQRQGFSLELSKEDGEVGMPVKENGPSSLTHATGVSFLQGRTEYGDSIEDEWVIVWLLRELSKTFAHLWIKVTDTDGEFLLIEASGTLPSWLEPEVAENRVWINDGQLKIIQPQGGSKSAKRTQEKLKLQDAREIMLSNSKRVMHSTSIEEEAFYRLRNYPAQIKDNMHHALVVIPRKVAFLLRQKPSYITPVVEKFYLRDPIALKSLQPEDAATSMTFPPQDMVTCSIRFPKVAYAQLKSQDFRPPSIFQTFLPSKSSGALYSRADIGMKITCGFEMLLKDPQNQDDTAVREIKLLLEDLETGDEQLPTDPDIQKWELREDDEKWLDIDFADLEQELGGREGNPEIGKKKTEFGDKAAQENLQRIVKQFEDFLNDDEAGPDGAGMFDDSEEDDLDDLSDDDDDDDSKTGEDHEASFDEDEFTKMMQEMMGMPPEVMKEIMTGKLGEGVEEAAKSKADEERSTNKRAEEVEITSADSDDDNDDESNEEMQTFMQQMEAELQASRALDLSTNKKADSSRPRQQLKNNPAVEEISDLSSDDANSDNDIDINLARNLLESFKAQGGMAGPGGNLMGLMGLGMPRDEPGNDNAAGPSKKRP